MNVSVVIPIRTKTGLNAREHHMARASRVAKERRATRLALLADASGLAGVGGVGRVLFTRASPALCDDDNLAGACKAVRDEVAAFLGVSDGPSGGVEWRYDQVKVKRGEYYVRVTIETDDEEVGDPYMVTDALAREESDADARCDRERDGD